MDINDWLNIGLAFVLGMQFQQAMSLACDWWFGRNR